MSSLSAKLGITDSVDIRNSVDATTMVDLARGAIGFIHPSRWESCSMVLNQMVAVGVPCAVHDVIHAAVPLRNAGLAVTFHGAAGIPAALKDLAISELGGPSQCATAQALNEDSVGRAYRKWLHVLAGEKLE